MSLTMEKLPFNFVISWIFAFLCFTYVKYSDCVFTDVTNDVLGGPIDGLMAVFGDFNMDKSTGVFVIGDSGHRVDLYMKGGNGSNLLNLNAPSTIERNEDTITSVASGDFDGDFQLDLLITTKANKEKFNKNSPTKAFIYWGDIESMIYDGPTLVTDQLADQPLVMDYNADMIPDLFGAEMNGTKKFWSRTANNTREFFEVVLTDREDRRLVVPNSNAFLDLTGNYAANLFMVTSEVGSKDVTFEIWSYDLEMEADEAETMSWRFTKEYAPPTDVNIEHLGVSTFADMNADSLMDHILPVCYKENCSQGAIYVRYGSTTELEWEKIFDLSNLEIEGVSASWGFVPPTTHLTDFTEIPIMARAGDFDLDTLTDLVIVVQAEVNGAPQRRIVLLQNQGSEKHLVPYWVSDPDDVVNPILASFIDVQRTGELDIMLSNMTSKGIAQTHLIQNALSVDAYFVRVEVLSALCPSGCVVGDNMPYGVNQPGPIVRYDTTGSTGQAQKTGGTQLSQSAYFSLQLPYIMLGLGQNPNFVDTLRLGVPGATSGGAQNKRVDEWTSIIPNSQLIIVPDPLDNPSSWVSKILIIPGQSVLLTGIVLISTCVVLALTAALLHLKERKDDEKEKRQEAHRFHFDAM